MRFCYHFSRKSLSLGIFFRQIVFTSNISPWQPISQRMRTLSTSLLIARPCWKSSFHTMARKLAGFLTRRKASPAEKLFPPRVTKSPSKCWATTRYLYFFLWILVCYLLKILLNQKWQWIFCICFLMYRNSVVSTQRHITKQF